jgi:translation initiation factor IF-3
VFGVADLRGFATNSRKSSGSRGNSGPSIIRNEGIKAKTMRVVYTDPATNESAWKIMERKEAIEFAKGMELDLVLVNGDSDPAVCKIQDYGRLVMDKSKEAKEKKVSQKARSLKEMFVKGGIEENDLKTKIKKVRQFLLVGHTVKIVVIAKKDILRRNPHAIDETTLKIIEKVEDYVKTVKQGRVGSAFRSDFILNPKTGEEIKKLQEDVAKQQKGELGDEELAA